MSLHQLCFWFWSPYVWELGLLKALELLGAASGGVPGPPVPHLERAPVEGIQELLDPTALC